MHVQGHPPQQEVDAPDVFTDQPHILVRAHPAALRRGGRPAAFADWRAGKRRVSDTLGSVPLLSALWRAGDDHVRPKP